MYVAAGLSETEVTLPFEQQLSTQERGETHLGNDFSQWEERNIGKAKGGHRNERDGFIFVYE